MTMVMTAAAHSLSSYPTTREQLTNTDFDSYGIEELKIVLRWVPWKKKETSRNAYNSNIWDEGHKLTWRYFLLTVISFLFELTGQKKTEMNWLKFSSYTKRECIRSEDGELLVCS